MISFEQLKKLNSKGNVIPVYRKIPADLDTPVGAFIKLAKNKKNSFLLESIEGGEKLARYSFVGFDPFLVIEGNGASVVVKKDKVKKEFEAPPQDFIKELFSVYKPIRIEELPRFTGGAVGYFAYDTIRWFEDIPDDNEADLDLPEMLFGLYRNIVAFDHLKQEIVIISNILHEPGESGLKNKYTEAKTILDGIVKQLQSKTARPDPIKATKPKVSADYSQEQFVKMVKKAKKYIKEGDIFQVVLSQRWQIESDNSPLQVYRNLRRLNPSPYMFLLNFGNNSIIGSSPEMMVRVENNQIETRPIAGTRPRGKNEDEDNKLIKSLVADEKELAEHTMLLDLGRNDCGRVSQPGTVAVKDYMHIEKYSHVIHIVSSVTGQLDKSFSATDGLFACFPAGTVSGAPKIRAMEIIDELEQYKRSVYAGAVAYIDFWGNLDSCIAIRTVVKTNGRYYLQAGAGIVADSKPKKEFLETQAKARALLKAITGDEQYDFDA